MPVQRENNEDVVLVKRGGKGGTIVIDQKVEKEYLKRANSIKKFNMNLREKNVNFTNSVKAENDEFLKSHFNVPQDDFDYICVTIYGAENENLDTKVSMFQAMSIKDGNSVVFHKIFNDNNIPFAKIVVKCKKDTEQ